MPNHCFNQLKVTATTPEELAGFMELARKPYETYNHKWDRSNKDSYVDLGYQWETHEAPLCFPNFVPIPTTNYWDYKDEEGKLHQNWYGWNIDNWGTKWDAYEIEVETASETEATYRFTTAYNPPLPVYEAIAEEFPNLKLWIHYEEENEWGGEIVKPYNSTLLEVVKEWDVPNSHADYAERDQEDRCQCAHENDQKYWYEDCPREEELVSA